MKASMRSCLLGLLGLLSVQATFAGKRSKSDGDAVAEFEGDIYGKISFEPKKGGGVKVKVNLGGLNLGDGYGYHIHESPGGVGCGGDSTGGHYDPTDKCGPASGSACPNGKGPKTYCEGKPEDCEIGDLSGKFGGLHPEGPDAEAFTKYDDKSLSLTGEQSIVGRSVVIHAPGTGTRLACAPIVLKKKTITRVATFNFEDGVTGTITLSQDAKDPEAPTTVTVDSTNTLSITGWHVHVDPVPFAGACGPEFTSGHYDPEDKCGGASASACLGGKGDAIGYSASCTTSTPEGCEVGDLSGKFGALPNGKAAVFTDMNLPLSGKNSVADMSIVLHVGKPRVACANLVAPKEAVAVFSTSSVFSEAGKGATVDGSITFTEAPQATKVTVDLKGLPGSNGYHIHELPVGMDCEKGTTGGHYDPTDKCGGASGSACPGGKGDDKPDADKYSVLCTTSTPEGCEIGDLSGQNGVLSEGRNELSFMANIDLSGDQNVVGRSIVIHQPGGDRYVCADIKYVGEVITRIASFEFDDNVNGAVSLTQLADDPLGPTVVVVNTAGGSKTTKGLHVHSQLTQPGQCGTTGGHYDPTDKCGGASGSACPDGKGDDKPDADKYSVLCTTSTPGGCEIGDLSGKLGGIDAATARMVMTDNNLPLSGKYSVAEGFSLVFHEDGTGDRKACANLVAPVVAVTKIPGDNKDVKGTITFTQTATNTLVDIKVKNLPDEEDSTGWHVHETPVGSDGSCGGDATGGHYDPTDKCGPASGSACTGGKGPKTYCEGKPEDCELGDLSGKYGKLPAKKAKYSFSAYDLPLVGPQSVVGRSIVIHDGSKTGNPRIACGDIVGAGEYTMVVANMDNGDDITGTITFTQRAGVADASTTITVDLVGTGANAGKWHVHQSPIPDDQPGNCAATGGHYDPAAACGAKSGSACPGGKGDKLADGVTDKPDEEKYSFLCTTSTPEGCEVGDQSSKFGTFATNPIEGGGRFVFTDMFLPLTGEYSVIDRAVVIHDATDSSIRPACGNLMEAFTYPSVKKVKEGRRRSIELEMADAAAAATPAGAASSPVSVSSPVTVSVNNSDLGPVLIAAVVLVAALGGVAVGARVMVARPAAAAAAAPAYVSKGAVCEGVEGRTPVGRWFSDNKVEELPVGAAGPESLRVMHRQGFRTSSAPPLADV